MRHDYSLSEEMVQLVHWSSTFVGADDHMDSVRAAYDALSRNYTPLRDGSVRIEDAQFQANGVTVPLRLYRPLGVAPMAGWPVVLYLHGGGFVVGNLESHEFLTAPMAKDLDAVVIAVDYRLAPEHVYPAALEDCLAAWQYVVAQADEWQLDANRMVLAGDSAGGQLVAVLSAKLKNAVVRPQGQALIYPNLTMIEGFDSHHQHAHAPLLSYGDMQHYWDQYAPEAALRAEPALSPLSAPSFAGLPATFVAIAEYDPLSDEGRAYVARLQAAGVAAQLYQGVGLIHGALRVWRDCPETHGLYQAYINALKAMLAKSDSNQKQTR